MKEKVLVRDIPVGVLLLVIAQFFIYGIAHIAKFPGFWEFFGILAFAELFGLFTRTGIRLVMGAEIDRSKQ